MTLSFETLKSLGITSQHLTVLLALLGLLAIISAVFSVIWATVKIGYQQVYSRPFPATTWTKRVDLILYVALNVPGAVNKYLKDRGKEALFPKEPSPLPEVTVSASTPVSPPSQ